MQVSKRIGTLCVCRIYFWVIEIGNDTIEAYNNMIQCMDRRLVWACECNLFGRNHWWKVVWSYLRWICHYYYTYTCVCTLHTYVVYTATKHFLSGWTLLASIRTCLICMKVCGDSAHAIRPYGEKWKPKIVYLDERWTDRRPMTLQANIRRVGDRTSFNITNGPTFLRFCVILYKFSSVVAHLRKSNAMALAPITAYVHRKKKRYALDKQK